MPSTRPPVPLEWQASNAPSFAPTTVAQRHDLQRTNVSGNVLQVRVAATGSLLQSLTIPGPIWSGVATVGDGPGLRCRFLLRGPAGGDPCRHPWRVASGGPPLSSLKAGAKPAD